MSLLSVRSLVWAELQVYPRDGLGWAGLWGWTSMEAWAPHWACLGPDVFALPSPQRWQDLNVISSLLKSFFRKLPEPLFTDGE